MYGAGITPSRSTKSANVASSHLKDSATFGGATGSVQQTQNILPPTLKTRSLPHWICSVAFGNERHNLRMLSRVTRQILQQKTKEQFTLRLMPITLTVNGQNRTLDIDPDTPLLWAIRETLGLTGTKFGCGIEQCGACTVHVNGKAERSCTMPVSSVDGATITTIEGLASGGVLSHVQQTWLEMQVPQCVWQSQIQVAQWSGEHPAWVVKKVTCEPPAA